MSNGKPDLDPRHVRQFLEMSLAIWTLFHIVLIIKLWIEKDVLMLLILTPFAIMNFWCIARVYRFYKSTNKPQ